MKLFFWKTAIRRVRWCFKYCDGDNYFIRGKSDQFISWSTLLSFLQLIPNHWNISYSMTLINNIGNKYICFVRKGLILCVGNLVVCCTTRLFHLNNLFVFVVLPFWRSSASTPVKTWNKNYINSWVLLSYIDSGVFCFIETCNKRYLEGL